MKRFQCLVWAVIASIIGICQVFGAGGEQDAKAIPATLPSKIQVNHRYVSFFTSGSNFHRPIKEKEKGQKILNSKGILSRERRRRKEDDL